MGKTGPADRVFAARVAADQAVPTSRSKQVAELTWVFRPGPAQPARSRVLAGARVHAMGLVGDDGRAELVLHDGTRLRATPAEVVAE